MVTRTPDALELLLPDPTPELWQRAQKLVTCLRLLSSDARAPHAQVVDVNLDRARGELERETERGLVAALRTLLRAHASAAIGPSSFAWFGEVNESTQAAWSRLEEHRDARSSLLRVPAPNESALSVAERALASLAELGVPPFEVALWSARLAALRGESAEAERALAELASREGLEPELRTAVLAARVELALDRGALRSARQLLDDHGELARNDVRSRRLAIWTRLLAGDASAARSAQSGASPWTGGVPSALVELRDDRPDWIAFLAGRGSTSSSSTPSAERSIGAVNSIGAARRFESRAEIGASVLIAAALEASGSVRAVQVDVAPALRAKLEAWWRERDGACRIAGQPEHRVVGQARRVVAHRREGEALRGSLDPSGTLALVVEPILDLRGEVAGWIWLEFEHHLIPARAELEFAARSWRERVLSSLAQVARREREPDGESAGDPVAPSIRGSARATAFETLVESLGMKLIQRHWWGFTCAGERLELVADGGAHVDGGAARTLGVRALERAAKSRGPVIFDDPDETLSIHPRSASGIVIPLAVRGELCGFLAIESQRRRDFRPPDCERWVARAASFASWIAAAQFRDWHAARFGGDLWLGEGERLAARVGEIAAAARSRMPIAIFGPPGSGKSITARWLHFAGASRFGPCIAFRPSAFDEAELDSRFFGERAHRTGALHRALGGTLIVEHLERAPRRFQSRLAQWIASSSDRAGATLHLVATSDAPLSALALESRASAELADAFGRFELRTEALGARREDIPGSIAVLARRFAASERLDEPRFSDDALALLFRQAWRGNLRELENVVYQLVLLHPGAEIGLAEVEAVARRVGLELVRRIPSRHPDPTTLRAALETTRHRRGGFNKTRAALYLGWDPDTLVSRMSELDSTHDSAAVADSAASADESPPS